MKSGIRSGAAATVTVGIAVLSLVWPAGANAQRPEGVTPARIAQGQELYRDTGCPACHGPDAKGVSGLTADLTDGQWKFVEGGELAALVTVIREGLTADKTGGMPMMANTDLSDDQVKAIAAYIWSVNQKEDEDSR